MEFSISPQDLEKSQNLIKDIFDEAVEAESLLAGKKKIGRAGAALQVLRERTIAFGHPQDRLAQLTKKLLKKMNIELDPIEKEQMESRYDYYFMAVPVSLYPKRGELFSTIECRLEFLTADDKPVIVKSLFPESKWRSVLQWGGGMDLALNGFLDWEIGVDSNDLGKIKKIPGIPSGNIKSISEIRSSILVQDYSFELGREEIVATGKGNSFCAWRLRDPKLKPINDLRFIVIFKVPKGLNEITLTGKIYAEPKMDILVAELEDVFSELSDKLKKLFLKPDDERRGEERLPVGEFKTWVALKLPRVE